MPALKACLTLLIVLASAGRAERIPYAQTDIVPPTAEWAAVVEANAPAKPKVTATPRKVLVFSLRTGFDHKVMPHVDRVFEILGTKSGAFTVDISTDIEALSPEGLRGYDVLVLNNNCSVGPRRNLFLDELESNPKYAGLTAGERLAKAEALEQSMLTWVSGGKGLVAVHGAPTMLNNSPEFTGMVGAAFDYHPANQEVSVRPVDPDHPLVEAFLDQGPFIHRDEPYSFNGTYHQYNFRPLLLMDTEGLQDGAGRVSDGVRYVAWIKPHGQGRVFYCSPSHFPESYASATLLGFLLDGVQYAAGDLKADDTPSFPLPPTRAESGRPRIRAILDSDANNELDDQHAIAYLLFNAGTFDVRGITVNRTHNGGTLAEQVAEAERVVKLCGVDRRIKVTAGADGDFETIRPHLGEARFDGADAVNLILEQSRLPGDDPLVLIPVGKLTTIALALAKDPTLAQRVRIVWLGSNYPEPGEYNQVNDEPALNFILDQPVDFEFAIVRYGKPSGTDAVRASREDIRRIMPGKGPQVATPVVGRHGQAFQCFGDYSVNLFDHIELHGNPPSRALFDMAAVAIVKDPSWATPVTLPAPLLRDGRWVERPENPHQVVVWEHFDRAAIMQDFYATMTHYRLAP